MLKGIYALICGRIYIHNLIIRLIFYTYVCFIVAKQNQAKDAEIIDT